MINETTVPETKQKATAAKLADERGTSSHWTQDLLPKRGRIPREQAFYCGAGSVSPQSHKAMGKLAFRAALIRAFTGSAWPA